MYFVPQVYKCSLCGHECQYSQHHPHDAPVVRNFIGCPKCWEEWLRKNIGCMELKKD